MLDRRTFMSFIAAAAAVPRAVWAQAGSKKVALYASVRAVLTHYDVDVDGLTLTARGSVTLPATVQYAWPHVSHRVLYVATSSSAAGTGPAGTVHHVSAFRTVLHGCPRMRDVPVRPAAQDNSPSMIGSKPPMERHGRSWHEAGRALIVVSLALARGAGLTGQVGTFTAATLSSTSAATVAG